MGFKTGCNPSAKTIHLKSPAAANVLSPPPATRRSGASILAKSALRPIERGGMSGRDLPGPPISGGIAADTVRPGGFRALARP
jgi:hypothetical protein